MKVVQVKCESCGAFIDVDIDREYSYCSFCGAKILTADVAPKQKVIINEKERPQKNIAPIIIVLVFAVFALAIILINVLPKKAETDQRIYKTAGVYEVGVDIDAGEYILYPADNADNKAELQVRLTRDIPLDKENFLYSKAFRTRQYVILNNGEFIDFKLSNLYKKSNIKLRAFDERGYSSAQLKVGENEDIMPGTYLIAGKETFVVYFISRLPQLEFTESLNALDVSWAQIENRAYVTVEEDDYIYFYNGKIYDLKYAPEAQKGENGEFMPGHYLIGKDIPYGQYILSPAGTNLHEFSLYKNTTKLNWRYIADEANYLIEEKTLYEDFSLTIRKSQDNDTYYLILKGITLKIDYIY